MTWASVDQDQIMAYLGYPVTSDQIAKVQAKMNSLQMLSDEAVIRVQAYLAELLQIDGQIEVARNSPGSAYSQLKAEARRFTSLVSLALNLDVYYDTWS